MVVMGRKTVTKYGCMKSVQCGLLVSMLLDLALLGSERLFGAQSIRSVCKSKSMFSVFL